MTLLKAAKSVSEGVGFKEAVAPLVYLPIHLCIELTPLPSCEESINNEKGEILKEDFDEDFEESFNKNEESKKGESIAEEFDEIRFSDDDFSDIKDDF